MAFEFRFAFTGNLDAHLRAKNHALASAVTGAMQRVAQEAKDDLRAQGKGFKRTPPYARRRGQDFLKSLRGDAYPNRRGVVSLEAAAVILAKPQFLEAFETGGFILPRRGRFLVQALPAAKRKTLERSYRTGPKGKRYRKYADIPGAEKLFGKLKLVPAKGGGFVLGPDREHAARQGMKPRRKSFDIVPLFYLRPSTQVPRKFNFDKVTRTADRDLPKFFERFYTDPE